MRDYSDALAVWAKHTSFPSASQSDWLPVPYVFFA